MSIYVYRKALSDGAASLAEALGGRRWRDARTPLSTKAISGDRVICWGDPFTKTGVFTLNSTPLRSKFTDAEVLRQAGVSTIEVSRTRPAAPAATAGPDPAYDLWQRLEDLATDFVEDEVTNPVTRSAPRTRGVQEIADAAQALAQALGRPVPLMAAAPSADWIGRATNHSGGTDLLNNSGTDYFSKKEAFVEEYRVHSFLGRSIRAGKKVHRTDDAWVASGRTPHAWVRSWDGGWRISYDGVSATQAQRDLAHASCAALGLDFGAVDIGQKADGTLVAIEVNRAPGLDGGTITKYAEAIQKWIRGEWSAENVPTREQRRRAA